MPKRYLRNSPVSNNDSNTPVHLANPTGKIQEITKIEAILTRAPTYSSKYYFNIEKNGQTQEVKIFDLSDQAMIDLIAMDFELHQGTFDYTFQNLDTKRLFGPNDKIFISFENSVPAGTTVPSYVKFKINFKEYEQTTTDQSFNINFGADSSSSTTITAPPFDISFGADSTSSSTNTQPPFDISFGADSTSSSTNTQPTFDISFGADSTSSSTNNDEQIYENYWSAETINSTTWMNPGPAPSYIPQITNSSLNIRPGKGNLEDGIERYELIADKNYRITKFKISHETTEGWSGGLAVDPEETITYNLRKIDSNGSHSNIGELTVSALNASIWINGWTYEDVPSMNFLTGEKLYITHTNNIPIGETRATKTLITIEMKNI